MVRQPALTQAAAKAALAAGVKNAAIVNYEKFVTHPATPAAATKQAETKLKAGVKSGSKTTIKADSKPGLKPGSRAVAHHAAGKSKPKAKNSASSRTCVRLASSKATAASKVPPDSRDTSIKTASAPPAITRVAKPASSPVSPVVAAGQKKPSAAIPKENPQN
jgi:hypothetical protein